MSNVVCAGGVVIKKEDSQSKMCLVNILKYSHLPDQYVFPKGHPENDETIEQTALREVKEEIGLNNLVIVKYLGVVTRKSTEKNGLVVDKDIHLFLMKTDDYRQQKSEETYDWFLIEDAIKVLLPEEKDFLILHQKEILGI